MFSLFVIAYTDDLPISTTGDRFVFVVLKVRSRSNDLTEDISLVSLIPEEIIYILSKNTFSFKLIAIALADVVLVKEVSEPAGLVAVVGRVEETILVPDRCIEATLYCATAYGLFSVAVTRVPPAAVTVELVLSMTADDVTVIV